MLSAAPKNRQKLLTAAYCLLVSFLLMMICTKSSFLYPLNDWSDPHCFINVGRGMMEGKVTYRDLFEQKGPLLYFLHGLTYLISPTSFMGVFLLETISFAVFLFYIHKIITMYLRPQISFLLLPVFSMVVLTSVSFNKGDSAEELALPLVAIAIYHLLRYFRQTDDKPMSYGVLLANGIFAGCVMWTKYTIVGFWFGWMASVFFALAAKKQFARAFKSCLVFLGGMALATLPWVIYFGVNHAIKDWIDSYIFVNLFSYTKKISLTERMIQWVKVPWQACKENKLIALLLALGAAAFMLCKKYVPRIGGKLAVIACVVFLNLTVYFRGAGYDYYFLIFAPFGVFGMIALADLLGLIIKKLKKKPLTVSRRLSASAAAVLCVLSTGAAYFLSPNAYAIGQDRNNYVQYRFAEIMNQTPNPTVFFYDFMDNGFAFAANITQTQKHFCGLNLPEKEFPELMAAQRQYIREKQTDYIVMREDRMDDPPYLAENYELVATQTQEYDGVPFVYYLYKAKP